VSTKVEENTEAQNDKPVEEAANTYSSDWGNFSSVNESDWGEGNNGSATLPAPPSEASKDGETVAEEPKKRVRRSRFDQPQPDSGNDEKQSRFDQPEDRKRRHSPSPK